MLTLCFCFKYQYFKFFIKKTATLYIYKQQNFNKELYVLCNIAYFYINWEETEDSFNLLKIYKRLTILSDGRFGEFYEYLNIIFSCYEILIYNFIDEIFNLFFNFVILKINYNC